MKAKKVTVEGTETVAFDNHQVAIKGEGLQGYLQLTNQSEFGSLKKGDVLTVQLAKEPKAEK